MKSATVLMKELKEAATIALKEKCSETSTGKKKRKKPNWMEGKK